jgi:hypothetical protein
MSLTPGTRLGPYEIVGAGGMGEAHRAHDARLHRDVVIKILPELFASDPDRLAPDATCGVRWPPGDPAEPDRQSRVKSYTRPPLGGRLRGLFT